MRSLHQQRPQIGITLFADVHLRFALPRVSASRLQSEVATRVPALAETMRIFQGQHVSQRDQRAYSFDLLQHCGLRIALLRDGFDALVVFGNAFTQRFQRLQQRSQRGL